MANLTVKIGGEAAGGKAALDTMAAATRTADTAMKAAVVTSRDVAASMSAMSVRFGDAHRSVTEMGRNVDAVKDRMSTFSRVLDGAVTGALMSAVSGIKSFISSSVEEFHKAEKAHIQLQHVAGDMTGTYEAMADALSEKLAIDDDEIMSVQRLLLSYGVQAEAIEKTTEAIFDYAVANDKDAVTATRTLMQAIDSGADGVRKLGADFDSTGNKGKDLSLAIESMGEKIGGSASAQANTLVGRSTAAGIAFDNAKEAVGGFISKLMDESGIVDGFTATMKGLANGIKEVGNSTQQAAGQLGIEWRKDMGAPIKQRAESDTAETMTFEEEDIDGKFKSKADKQKKADEERTKLFDKAMKDAMENGKASIDEAKRVDEEKLKNAEEMDKYFAELQQKENDYSMELQKTYDNNVEAEQKRSAAEQKRVAKELADDLARQQEDFRMAGATIGAAFVNAVASELDKLGTGGEFDLIGFIGGLLGVIGGVVGGVVGGPGGAMIGSSLGNLGAAGLRAATRGPPKKRHDGGWIEAERFHSGGWPGLTSDEVPIIAKKNERMLSEMEVATMGGPNRVDSMARGGSGGGVTVQISAVDARGLRDMFMDEGARGFSQAVKTGRGQLVTLFRDGVR